MDANHSHHESHDQHGPQPVHLQADDNNNDDTDHPKHGNGSIQKNATGQDSSNRSERLSRIHHAAAAVAQAVDAAVDEYELRHDHTLAALEVLRERQQSTEKRLSKIEYEQGEINRGVAQIIQNQKGGVDAYAKLTHSIKTITDHQTDNADKLDHLESNVHRLRQLVTTLTILTTIAVVGLVVVVILGAASMFVD